MTQIRFDDKVAIVTGAGFGQEYVLEQARWGACAVLNDLGSLRDGNGTVSYFCV